MARYIIIGAGAVGASIAALFEKNGIDYVLVGRGQQIKKLAEDGLYFTTDGFEGKVALKTAADPDDVTLTEHDRFILTVKTQDADSALQQWVWREVQSVSGSVTTFDLPLITLQNGLEAPKISLRWFKNVYAGMLLIPANYVELGRVTLGAGPKHAIVALGHFPSGADEVLSEIAHDLRKINFVVEETDRITDYSSAKLLHSVKNAVEILAGSKEEISALGKELSTEARNVLQAAGYQVGNLQDFTEDVSDFQIKSEAGYRPGQQSTWQSVQRGANRTEADFFNGEIGKLGREFSVPTPYNDALQAVVGTSVRAGEQVGSHSVSEIFERVGGHINLT